MNVVIVSQCSKRALTESRRILDQFAERRGDRTWQTSITQDGLDALRQLLRKTARKNTAVACHWIRGIDHSELLWIVGDTKQFNIRGAVPTDSTTCDILRNKDENNWNSLQTIYLLSALSALLHDIGKSCSAFQNQLTSRIPFKNLYRHEWISLRLFQAFVGLDDDNRWLERLADPNGNIAGLLERLQCDGVNDTSPPFRTLPPLAQIIGWLIVSHHRLPEFPEKGFRTQNLEELLGNIDASWNQNNNPELAKTAELYWGFPHLTPFSVPAWRARIGKIAGKLLRHFSLVDCSALLDDPFVMHLSRLCLILADHDYSSLRDPERRIKIESDYKVFANTDRKTGNLNQPLDEHLLGVESLIWQIVHSLPTVAEELPRLARHRGLRQRSGSERFRWQDRCVDQTEGIRQRSFLQGAFIVNMASTGCGKTLANARMMYALTDPERGMRCAFALGLRTLTWQTGREYRERLLLGEDEVAIRVGGSAIRELQDLYGSVAEKSGSASAEPLFEEDGHVFFEGNPDSHPILTRLLDDVRVRSLLSAPMLVCTIDHLIPATEGTRGGHQIAPILRLLSGDLVLDELDDYDIQDLPAVARLMHWAGLLGCRVLVSSATLPPALVRGMFEAYREGRLHYQKNRGERPNESPDICCLWVDEFTTVEKDCHDSGDFSKIHEVFAEKRRDNLSQAPVLRRGILLNLKNGADGIRQRFAEQALNGALDLHMRHCEADPQSGKRISFGLIRMANIDPLVDVALSIFKLGVPEGVRLHLCVYHSQYPLLIRSSIESRLDKALFRYDPQSVFSLPDIRQRLDAHQEEDHLFVVLGSPITEVGRDHDYDWAVVEPSSMRSLIQLAGRVRRHRRSQICESPNICIFDYNIKSLEQTGKPAYCRPGFENAEFMLENHSLTKLLAEEEWSVIDSRPRIVERKDLRPKTSLVDLEHERLRKLMLPSPKKDPTQRDLRAGISNGPGLGAYSWWTYPKAMLTGALQKEQKFRGNQRPSVDLILLPTEDGEDYRLMRIEESSGEIREVPVEKSLNHRISENEIVGNRICLWGVDDYMTALGGLAEDLGYELEVCARRFGTVRLPDDPQGWRFHSALGFSSLKKDVD